MTIEERLRQFIVDNFYVTDPAEIRDDTALVTGGYVDSTGVLEILSFLEKEFAISISDVETTPDNLDTIARIASFIARKKDSARS